MYLVSKFQDLVLVTYRSFANICCNLAVDFLQIFSYTDWMVAIDLKHIMYCKLAANFFPFKLGLLQAILYQNYTPHI